MFKTELLRTVRRLITLSVLLVGLGVTAFSPPQGEAYCLPCCSACDFCYNECDLKPESEREGCYAGCNALCKHGCNPAC
jgi:hypothetical protein